MHTETISFVDVFSITRTYEYINAKRASDLCGHLCTEHRTCLSEISELWQSTSTPSGVRTFAPVKRLRHAVPSHLLMFWLFGDVLHSHLYFLLKEARTLYTLDGGLFPAKYTAEQLRVVYDALDAWQHERGSYQVGIKHGMSLNCQIPSKLELWGLQLLVRSKEKLHGSVTDAWTISSPCWTKNRLRFRNVSDSLSGPRNGELSYSNGIWS